MRVVKAGTVDVSVVIRIIDSTDGTPETGVVWNTAGIDLQYRREGAVSTAITEATLAALTTAHMDGGFLHIGNGYYRLDLPDAACAAGVTGAMIHGTVTGMVVIGEYIQLVAYDPFDGVRQGLTALPNAAADAAGGLPISDAGGLDMDRISLFFTGAVAYGTVNARTSESDFTLTSTELSANNNDYDNMWLVFLDNNNQFVPRVIGTYTGATKRVQFTGSGLQGAFPQTVQAGDKWFITAGIA